MSDERQVPFFCPYCGDETLRPASAEAGAWTCSSCARTFSLKFAGLIQGEVTR
jgi:ribosomal protein L37AE/L43A